MKKIFTPKQMYASDAAAIDRYGIPSLILMENVAKNAANILIAELRRRFPDVRKPRILFLCGSGNNGGDGYAMARHCLDAADVRIARVGLKEQMSEETSIQCSICEKLGIPIAEIEHELSVKTLPVEAHCIVDALIGAGGSESLRGITPFLLQKISGAWDSSGYGKSESTSYVFRVAVDVPTGLNPLTGAAHLDAFCADLTIAAAAPKLGMLINDGKTTCGEIVVADFGIPSSFHSEFSRREMLETTDIPFFFPPRRTNTSKFDYGKTVVVGGSAAMSGAPALAANAAIKSGAGFVYLLAPNIHSAVLPEIIAQRIDWENENINSNGQRPLETLQSYCLHAGSIAMGMGMGRAENTLNTVRDLYCSLPELLPVVLDADALAAFSAEDVFRPNTIITPHVGECARLTSISRKEIEENSVEIAENIAKKYRCIVHLKTVPAVTTDGINTSIVNGGNPGMATAGSGDVLAGIIAGFLSQGFSSYDAARVGAFIHARAGDSAKEIHGEYSMTASDIVGQLGKVMQ